MRLLFSILLSDYLLCTAIGLLSFRVFANAETLFYYSTCAPTTSRMLSMEEIQALLAKTRDEPPKANSTDVSMHKEAEQEGEEYGNGRGSSEETFASPASATDPPDDPTLDDYDGASMDDVAAKPVPSDSEHVTKESPLTSAAGEILEQGTTRHDPNIPGTCTI